MIHQHSIEAYHSEADKLSRRAWLVLAWIDMHGPATDREVMQGMGFQEPNSVRPRITELIGAGLLIEKASKRCPVTGKTVRIVSMPPRQLELVS